MARILIIDDDESLLQMMSLMLKRAGHEPILAKSGQEGIEMARDLQPDLAVVDIMMPDLTGHEVCRILREDSATADIPLLILTALNQHEQRDMAVDSGADDFVTKPVTRDDLVGHVEELLRTGPQNYPVPEFDYSYGLASSDGPAGPGTSLGAAPPPDRFGPVPESAARPVASSQLLPVTAVMGLCTGVGATTIAVNLGFALAEVARTCVVDLHGHDGRAAIQLRMSPPRATWASLLKLRRGTDKRFIGGALTFDSSKKLALIASPVQPVDRLLSADQLDYLLSALTEAFPSIVLSLPPELNPMTEAALFLAKRVVLVIGEDPADLPVAGERLKAIQRLGLRGELKVALNRTRPYGVSSEDVIQAIKAPLNMNFPYEPAQVQAVTEGMPLIRSRPESLFSHAVRQLAQQWEPGD